MALTLKSTEDNQINEIFNRSDIQIMLTNEISLIRYDDRNKRLHFDEFISGKLHCCINISNNFDPNIDRS